MDNFIIRWYNKNRKLVWTTIVIIIAVIVLLRGLENYYKNEPKEETSTTIGTTDFSVQNYSVVTQEEINENVSQNSIDLIDAFFGYCNNGEIEIAYYLISADCKQELYPTIEKFKENYYNKIFTEKMSYNYMLWITDLNAYTYKIEIMPDLLATGKKQELPIQDFYTIINENGEYKLNISNYIGKEKINIGKTENNITINIVSKKTYMNYETYEIEIQNNTGDKLVFNTKQNTNSIYIQDENELKNIAFLNEILNSELEILNGITKTLNIKFNRTYKPNKSIEKIVFSDIYSNNQIKTIGIEL